MLALMLTACSAPVGGEQTTTPESSSTAPATTITTMAERDSTTSTMFDQGDIVGFATTEVTLGGERLVLALADELGLRARGLMGVEDFGDYDGMLFSWSGETVTGRFFMLNTPVPLTIAFFSAEGALVDSFVMTPCPEEPCHRYTAAGPYAFAIEFPADRVVDPVATLEL